jgi:5'-3' exonuclease
MKEMKNLEEVQVNAVYFYIKILFSMVKQFKGSQFGIFFDSKTNFRREIYPNYKIHRKKTEDVFKFQLI